MDPRPTEGSASGNRGRASLRSGEDLPPHVFSSTGVAADLPRTTFCDAICSGERGEVISLPHGMSCVGHGRDNRRRRRVSSSEDSDFAPLVSRPVASVGVLDALSPTQWEVSASVDISSDDERLVRPNVGRDVAARTVQSDEQVRPTLMDGASPNGLGSGRHGVRSAFPTPTRRRRLVVEVAPNVVDVSAVALPGSPLFVTNMESDGEGVSASHPWDSDEEDELDTHSRNRAGVPILGQDPPFSVPPTVPASSDATVGGRPRQFERSRDASIATQADNDNDADDERHPLVPEDVVLALESDLAVAVARSAEENTPVGSDRPCKFRGSPTTIGGGGWWQTRCLGATNWYSAVCSGRV